MKLHREAAGAGPDVVLLHGWGMSSRAWGRAAADLAARHRVHRIDLPGHGRSDPMAINGLDDWVESVARELPDGSLVCGWSLGAIVALRLARSFPRKVRALALVGATPCFAARADWPHGMADTTFRSFEESVSEDATAALASFVTLACLGPRSARENARELREGIDAGEPPHPGALKAGLEILGACDERASLVRIAFPALVVHGARDAVASVEAGRFLARALPSARLVEIEAAGHAPFLSHREAFVAAIEALDG